MAKCWSKWGTAQYEKFAWDKIESVMIAILNGYHRSGVISLFNGIPEDIPYPPVEDSKELVRRLGRRIIAETEKYKALQDYTFEVEVDLSRRQPIIRFIFCPLDVRLLSEGKKKMEK